MNEFEIQCSLIKQGTAQIIGEDELRKKLSTGQKLRIKFGVDPTSPDLHLGHAVALSKLREFQELGHEIIFLIGDFTSRIGDPTGKSKTRPPLTEQEIAHNMQTYIDQVGKILDPARITVRYNSEWLDRLTFRELIQLCAKITVARLIEREDFAQRLGNKQPIGLHELLYPLIQAYDSVALRADVELGGTDQTFNLIMGRFLQEQLGQEAQAVITVPLLEGTDGTNKMSKSLGNAIGLAEPADQAYGKIMSIPDSLVWRYYALLLRMPPDEISTLQSRMESGTMHPMTIKKDLAHAILTRFWQKEAADAAQTRFEEVFQEKDYSHAQEMRIARPISPTMWIVDLIKATSNITSSSEIKRLIEAKAVVVDGKTIDDFKTHVTVQDGMTLRVGKQRIYKIVYE
jgi:tyrosyl-tRNA synthetase